MPKDKTDDKPKHAGGRPPYYTTKEEMQKLVDQYFEECGGEILLDKDGNPRLTKYDEVIYIKSTPPSIAGLSYALGFTSRQSLLNYADKPEFMDIITRAKLRIEIYNNSRLYDKDGVQGAKFNLTVNYGYVDKTETDLNITMPSIIIGK